MDRWFEVSSRRSRLRSATRMLAPLHTPSEGTGGIAKTAPVLENAGTEGTPKRQRKPADRAEDDADPDYRLFLDHLKVDGKSYVLEMEIGDSGRPVRLKYEGADVPFIEVRDGDDSGDVVSSQFDRRPGKVSSKPGHRKAKTKARKGCSSSNSSEVTGPGSVERGAECSMVDEDYQRFLNHVREYNGSMILELDDNVTVRYEEEDTGSKKETKGGGKGKKEGGKKGSNEGMQEFHIKTEESEEESYLSNSGTALQPYGCSPLPSKSFACEDDVYSIETMKYRMSPLFTNKLMAIVKKPFDRSEYDSLMLLATCRTPKMKLKHLRNMSKPYATGEMGHSYLDYYPKLANEIKNSDYREGLTLLRGFFFWLENVVHDGAFMPWLSASSGHGILPSAGCSPMRPLQIEMSEN